MSWREFWNGAHSIYVNERHGTLHYQGIARDIAALLPSGEPDVLDHGCGDALAAGEVAARCRTLYLYDLASNVQDRLKTRFAYESRVIVLSNSALDVIGDASLDCVIVNSLLQYLSVAEYEALLGFWHAKLKSGGRLVVADVIPPDVSPVDDVKALLAFAWQGGFFFAAIGGLVATFFSDYRKLRGRLGLTTYAEADMISLIGAHGFKAERAARNIGHNQARMTFVASASPLPLAGEG